MFVVSASSLALLAGAAGMSLFIRGGSVECRFKRVLESMKVEVTVRRSKRFVWGKRMWVDMPLGISSADIQKRSQAISEALHRDIEVRFDQREGLLVDVLERSLERTIPYAYQPAGWNVPIGRNRYGEVVHYDFQGGYPHLLIAGISGGGKSVCLRSILTSLSLGPKPLMFLCDLKGGVELGIFRDLAHVQVFATDLEGVLNSARQAAVIMRKRYALMARRGQQEWIGKRVVFVIDELAELRIWGRDDARKALKNAIKEQLNELSAKGRAAGIDLILATQRPTVDVIDGAIKTNIATTIAFRTRDGVQSRVILDNDRAASLPDIPGRCIIQQRSDEVIQAFNLPYAQARDLLETVQRRTADDRHVKKDLQAHGNTLELG